MRNLHRNRLAQLALALLEAHMAAPVAEPGVLITPNGREIEFSMSWYANVRNSPVTPHPKQVPECATSCCFLGYSPFVFPRERQPAILTTDWANEAKYVIGNSHEPGGRTTNSVWQFLFASDWPSIPVQAVSRAIWLLQADHYDWVRRDGWREIGDFDDAYGDDVTAIANLPLEELRATLQDLIESTK